MNTAWACVYTTRLHPMLMSEPWFQYIGRIGAGANKTKKYESNNEK